MLPLPARTDDAWELADWLELNALVSQAGQASLDDMRDGLRTGAPGYGADGLSQQADQLEEIAANVRSEIASRAKRARRGYPFRLKGSSLERTIHKDRRSSSTYAFCLLLSVIPWKDQRSPGYFPDRIFEEVSCCAVGNYMGGKALRFGWPRKGAKLPSRFDAAVTKLCVRVGEGTRYCDTNATGAEKDAGLDVVAWRPIDDRPGKLLVFGACATGSKWEDKLNELQPNHFCETYFQDSITPKPAKAFFTPRVIPEERWRNYTSRAGMLFDRCRVSELEPVLPAEKYHGDAREWMRTTMGSADGAAA